MFLSEYMIGYRTLSVLYVFILIFSDKINMVFNSSAELSPRVT